MPPQGPALTFDPRYVTSAIDVWRTRDLAPFVLPDLERATTRLIRERFIAWTTMGMREQTVSESSVTKAINLLTALKLAKKTTRGTGETRVITLTPTRDGRDALVEEPVSGAVYLRFAERLSKASGDIANLLDLLASNGPFVQPILHPIAEAPRRGAAYQSALKEGLHEFQRQMTGTRLTPSVSYEPASLKATPAQRLKAAQTWAAQAHPAGTLKQIDKAVAVGVAFGLLWVDVVQINEVIGSQSIGLAATSTAAGYRPNILSWPDDSGAFIPALISAISSRANGSGFATIQDVRGAIGRALQLSPIAVDIVLRQARDAGDRHEIPIELHFEPDEDQLYAQQRDPLIWREEAFEFITVLRASRI